MARYKLISLTSAIAGQEEDFNDWYDKVHLPDVLALSGVRSARRYRLIDDEPRRYMAEYEIDCEDIGQWQAYLSEALKKMVLPHSIDRTATTLFYAEPL